MVRIYVPDIPEFAPFIDGARLMATCVVCDPVKGYWQIIAEAEMRFERRALGLGPALWNSILTGGFRGKIAEYGRDCLHIVSET